jgi:60S ribosome subunit biogenesis protein NIP7
VKLSIANLATSFSREKILSLGTCIGKFTKSGKFRMHITALPIIGPYARHKIWIRPNGVMVRRFKDSEGGFSQND